MARLHGKVEKGWGYELIWATNDLYCGKIMVFEKVGSKLREMMPWIGKNKLIDSDKK